MSGGGLHFSASYDPKYAAKALKSIDKHPMEHFESLHFNITESVWDYLDTEQAKNSQSRASKCPLRNLEIIPEEQLKKSQILPMRVQTVLKNKSGDTMY